MFPYIPPTTLLRLLTSPSIVALVDEVSPSITFRMRLFSAVSTILQTMSDYLWCRSSTLHRSLHPLAQDPDILTVVQNFDAYTQQSMLHVEAMRLIPSAHHYGDHSWSKMEENMDKNSSQSLLKNHKFLVADLPQASQRGYASIPGQCILVSQSLRLSRIRKGSRIGGVFNVYNPTEVELCLHAPILLSTATESWFDVYDEAELGVRRIDEPLSVKNEENESFSSHVYLKPHCTYSFSVIPRHSDMHLNQGAWMIFIVSLPDGEMFTVARSVNAQFEGERKHPEEALTPSPKTPLSSDALPFRSEALQHVWKGGQMHYPSPSSDIVVPEWFITTRDDLVRRSARFGTHPLMDPHFAKQLHGLALEIELQRNAYDMFDLHAIVLKAGRQHGSNMFYTLSVPGLAEGRPAISVGDIVFLLPAPHVAIVDGIVSSVSVARGEVMFAVSADCANMLRGAPCSVRFTANVSSLEILQAAISAVAKSDMLTRVICPASTEVMMNAVRTRRPYYARRFYPQRLFYDFLNPLQKLAVTSILNRDSAPYIFALWGPPGTGKSVTLVECILQRFCFSEEDGDDVRILACAPSNYAADLLVMKLLDRLDVAAKAGRAVGLRPGNIVRVNDPRRQKESIPVGVLNSVYDSEDGDFLSLLPHCKVLVCTCMTASLFMQDQIREKFRFSDIYVDEAAQALEAETYVPFLCASERTALVLCGDPMQLGPVVHHRDASVKLGLGQSLLARFLLQPVAAYGEHLEGLQSGETARFFVKLLYNYRSHPGVLQFSSNIFYDGGLLSCSEDPRLEFFRDTDALQILGWNADADFAFKGKPFAFVHVEGKQKRVAESSFSWTNAAELQQVVTIVQCVCRLLREHKIPVDQVSVMATFRSQVALLRKALRDRDLGGVKVGIVDDMQGQEALVVILSTVATNSVPVGVTYGSAGWSAHFDEIADFVADARRLNVSLSRAKSLMIIVGHAPFLHGLSAEWSQVLEICQRAGRYVGPPLGPNQTLQTRSSDDDVFAMEQDSNVLSNETFRSFLLRGNSNFGWSQRL
jgi:hypothetical protein